MYNKYLTTTHVGEIKQRVYNTLQEVIGAYRAGSIATREELLEEYSSALSKLYSTVANSLYEQVDIEPDTVPTIQEHNIKITAIRRDLVLLFSEMRRLGIYMLNLYTQMVSEGDDLTGRLKRTSSKLSDYLLYTGHEGVVVSEGFVDSANLDIGSSLLANNQCNISYNEGVATCSLANQDVISAKGITIDQQTFTGVVGSNEDVNASGMHSTLSDITDGDPDTWTELELTYFLDEEKPDDLKATVILELEKPTIINYIEIDPVNFGLLNSVVINDIQVSEDGTDWVSIKNDMPLADYAGETEDDTFILSPSSGKFSGIFCYSFLPRKVKYISASLTQDTPYIIDTNNGSKYRLAIGIRSIDVYSNKYSDISEVVSTVRSINGVIRKAALLSARVPEESNLGNVDFYLSFDDGNTWRAIQPLDEDDWEQEEIVNVEGEYSSLRIKAVLQRNASGFEEATSITGEQETETTVDVITANTGSSPISHTTSKVMANSNVFVIGAPHGSRGTLDDGRPRFKLGTGIADSIEFKLPFDIYPQTNIRKQDVYSWVGGKRYTRVEDITQAGSSDLVFEITSDSYIKFGDGYIAGGNGFSPPTGAIIEVGLIAESLYFQRDGDDYVAELDLPTDGNKDNVLLEYAIRSSSSRSFRLTPGVTSSQIVEHRLPDRYIISSSITITELDSNGSVPGTPAFSNLESSLTDVDAVGDYYIDYDAGVIYVWESFPSSVTVTVRYRYTTHYGQEGFNLGAVDNSIKEVIVNSDNLNINTATDITGQQTDPWGFGENASLPSAQSVVAGAILNLSHGSLIEDSVVLEDGIFGSDIIPKEVPFIDGNTELSNVLDSYEEALSTTTTYTVPGIYYINLQNGNDIVAAAGISFADDNTGVFASAVNPPAAHGQYHVNYSAPNKGRIDVYLNSALPSGITASYAYTEDALTNSPGKYSVDYRDGKVYCYSTISSGYKITYNYTKYRCHYNIGKTLPSNNVTIDQTNSSISIKTNRLKVPTLNIFYEYIPVQGAKLTELMEYFSPILRDIRLRILTSDMVI